MAKKLYEETNLMAVGNALRRKLGNFTYGEFNVSGWYSYVNVDGDSFSSDWISHSSTICLHAEGAVKWVLNWRARGNARIEMYPGEFTGNSNYFPDTSKGTKVYENQYAETQVVEINSAEYISFHTYAIRDYLDTPVPCGLWLRVAAFDEEGNNVYNSGYLGSRFPLIHNKLNKFTTANMASAIDSIVASDEVVMPTFGTAKFEANGVYNAIEHSGVDGFSTVEVAVPDPPLPTIIDYTITENGTFYADDQDAYGFRSVSVNVPVSAVSMDFDKDISADYYPVVKTDSLGNIIFCPGGISNETRGVMGTSTATYKIWLPSGGWEVGKNIMEHTLTPVSLSNSSYFYQGYFCLVSASITTPTLDDLVMKYWGESTGPIYRYGSCSITNSDAVGSMGQLAIVDTTGMVKFAGTWQQVIDALNARTVDVSKGFVLLTSTYFSSNKAANRKYGRIDFN